MENVQNILERIGITMTQNKKFSEIYYSRWENPSFSVRFLHD